MTHLFKQCADRDGPRPRWLLDLEASYIEGI